MKLVVGYLATPGGADAVALGARLARTLGAELELCIVLLPDRAGTARLSVGDYDELLAEQAREMAERGRAIPADVVARSHVSFADSFAEGLIREIARLEADAIVVVHGVRSRLRHRRQLIPNSLAPNHFGAPMHGECGKRG